MQLKRMLIYLLFFTISAILTGCWDRTELNDITIVLGIGLDYVDEEMIELSVEVELPGSVPSGPNATGDDQSTFVHSAKGKTIADALANLQNSFSRRLFLSHNRILVFSEEYVRKKGVGEEVEFINRFPNARLRSKVFVTDSEAKQLLMPITQLRPSTAAVLNKINETGVVPGITARDVILGIYLDEREIYIPMVAVSEDIAGSVEGKNQIDFVGMAIFHNNIMVDKLDLPLTRGFLWLIDEIEFATVTVQPKEADHGHITAFITDAKSRLIPKIENGKWKILVEAMTEMDIAQNSTNLDMTDVNILESVEKELEQQIVKRMEETLKKVQKEIKSDVLGFGERFHEKYPQEWREKKDTWDEFFPEIEVEFDVTVHIRKNRIVRLKEKFY